MSGIRIIAILLTITLAACTPRLGNWTKAGTTEDERSQALLDCELNARQTIQRDRAISRDIAGARQPDAMSGGTASTAPLATGDASPGALTQYQEDQLRRRLVSECMTSRGYALQTQ